MIKLLVVGYFGSQISYRITKIASRLQKKPSKQKNRFHMERDAGVFDFCRRIVEDGKLTEDEVYGLSDFINEQVNDCSNAVGKWPTCIVLEPLKEVWSDGALDGKELKKLAEILVSIV